MNAFRALLSAVILTLVTGAPVNAIGPEAVLSRTSTESTAVVGSIVNLTALLEIDSAGVSTNLQLDFVLTDDSLSSKAYIEIDFPAGFQLSAIDSIIYADNDVIAPDFLIEEWEVTGQHLSIELDSLEDLPDAGTTHTLTLYNLTNPTLAEEYQIVVTLLTADDRILALPAWSAPFLIRPGPLTLFDIAPGGIQEASAGTTLHFYVETQDQFGNLVDIGTVIWSLMGVPQVTGVIDQSGNFMAQHTGASRVIATYQDFADTSSLVYVLPGAFAYFSLTGGPDSIAAGEPWHDGEHDVVVTAYDLYGNIKTEYEEQFYFEASDPGATLPATEIEPDSFELADEGRKTVPASEFTFYRAGRQSLKLMQSGVEQALISPIAVVAGSPDDFNISIPQTVTAGQNFNISISNATDTFGNPVSGQVILTVISGGGNSPSGASPSLPNIAIFGGSGSGVARLVASGQINLRLKLGSVEKTAAITVLTEQTDRFDFEIDPVQPIGQPFAGTAKLTARDLYGNIVTTFSASADSVVITATGAGQVLNRVLKSSQAFANGIADLVALGVGYYGNELYVQFTATSQTGIAGQSQQVAMSSVKITSSRLLNDRRYVGEDFTAEVTISNFGNEAVTVQELKLFANDSELTGLAINPEPSVSVGPLQSQLFKLTAAVPNQPGETLTISASFSGSVAENAVQDSTEVGELEILAATGISAVAGTLDPMVVNTGRDYAFTVTIQNDNIDALQLTQESELVIDPGSESEYRAALASAVTVDGESQQVLAFNTNTIPVIDADSYPATLFLDGSLGTLAYSATIPIDDEVTFETPPLVTYLAASLSPNTIYRGREVDFTLDLSNSGSAGLALDLDVSRLTIFAGARQLTAELVTSQIAGAPDDTQIALEQLFIPSDFPGELDSLILIIRGESNGHVEYFRSKLPQGELTVPGGASVRIGGTAVNAPNEPFVNVLQQFSLEVTVSNTGAEALEQITVALTSNGSSTFNGSAIIDAIDVDTDTTVSFIVEAAGNSTISELFTATIQSATGSQSQLPATIQAPANPTQTVVVQTPASLSLTSQIDSPPQAQDGRVELGDAFIIAASVINSGQGSVGSGTVEFKVIEGDFVVDSPLEQQFNIGEKLQWGITAPADDDTARFAISIFTEPLQANNGQAAKVVDRADTIMVISAVQQVIIGVDFEALGPQLVSPGEGYDVLELNFDIVGADQSPYLDYLEFGILNRAGEQIAASSVIQAAALDYNNQSPVSATPSNDMLRFPLGPSSGLPQSATIQIDVANQPTVSDFTLFLDSASFAAKYQSAAGTRDVPVIARFANRLLIEQQYTLVEKQLEESFFSYPNPFSPLRERATIVFNLEDPNPATLTIYTLTGDEVIKIDVAAASGGEPVTYEWDGRNQAGQVVLNGIYLAILEVPGVGEVRTKIAVMK